MNAMLFLKLVLNLVGVNLLYITTLGIKILRVIRWGMAPKMLRTTVLDGCAILWVIYWSAHGFVHDYKMNLVDYGTMSLVTLRLLMHT